MLKPLAGTAAKNAGFVQANLAKEVIYSNKNLGILIEKTGLDYSPTGEQLSDRDIEYLKAQFRAKILLDPSKNNTLKISYKNTNPELAFLVVNVISQLFIEESSSKRKNESIEAYNFIEKRVNEYELKLENITKSIDEFKSENIELQIDTTKSVNARVGKLKEQIRVTSLKLKEAIVSKESLTAQLEIESAKGTIVEEENANNERLLDLEYQLNTMRLSYTETYPDIVLIKEQIDNLKRSIKDKASRQSSDTATLNLKNSNTGKRLKVKSAFYQQLQQQLFANKTTIRTLSFRKNDQEQQLALELDRSGEVIQVFNRLKELSRDYDVTKALYVKLKEKRENARIILNLESENVGSQFKVQEPPVIPLVPDGIRFLHFALGSLIVGVGLPLAIIFGLLMIDPRIRHEDDIGLGDEIPIIGIIPIFKTAKDLKYQRLVTIQTIIIFSLSLGLLVTLTLSRYFEVI